MLATLGPYLGLGAVAGLLSGLFGIGGGIVVVPFLVWHLTEQGFPQQFIMLVAVATSLASIVFTSLSASYAHHRHGAIHWPTALRLTPGILLGTLLGTAIAHQLPVAVLKLIFGCFLVTVALRMLSNARRDERQRWLPSRRLLGAAGLLIGSLSAVLGIGGGTLTVPFLTKCRYPMHQAVAISSACGFPLALMGAASYIWLGWDQPLPGYSLGYIYLPALFGIIPASAVFAPIGAWLAHKLPTMQLKWVFALVLFIIGLKMLAAGAQAFTATIAD